MTNDCYPNIFEHATKELSQDAFFCWLFEWLKPEYTSASNLIIDASREFMRIIVDKINELEAIEKPFPVTAEDIEVIEVTPQVKHVDIVVVMKAADDQTIALIIEDKVNAMKTGMDQLERNYEIQKTIKRKFGEDTRCIGVFLKTGYDFDMKVPEQPPYIKVNYNDIKQWIESEEVAACDDVILKSWVESYKKKLAEHELITKIGGDHLYDFDMNLLLNRKRGKDDIFDPEKLSGIYSKPWFQYKLFKAVFNINTEDITIIETGRSRYACLNKWKCKAFCDMKDKNGKYIADCDKKEYFRMSTNNGGLSYIQYRFPFPLKDIDGVFFYRLDVYNEKRNEKKWTILLKHYKHGRVKTEKEMKLYKELREKFDSLCVENGVKLLKTEPNTKNYETRILAVDLQSEIQNLHIVHEKFMEILEDNLIGGFSTT